MIKKLTIVLLIIYVSFASAQVKPENNNFNPTEYWEAKTSMFRILPNSNGEIIFVGDSITDRCEWNELFSSEKVINRGLSGDETIGVLNRLDEIIESNPQQIFLMIGVNDLRHGVPLDSVVKNYQHIIKTIRTNSPATEIIVQSILPVNNKIKNANTDNQTIVNLNKNIRKISEEYNIEYVDLFSMFIDDKGNLKSEYTNDGLHITGNAYLIWKREIEDYIKI